MEHKGLKYDFTRPGGACWKCSCGFGTPNRKKLHKHLEEHNQTQEKVKMKSLFAKHKELTKRGGGRKHFEEPITVIGIVGSRRRDSSKDYKAVENALFAELKGIEKALIVSGGCPKGGDRFAEMAASKHGISIRIYYPKWHRYGRIAGFMRNTLIAEDCDVLIACVHKDRKGGTEDTIKKAEKLGKRVVLI